MSTASSTPIGVLDGAPPAWVDDAGTLQVGDTEVQWWIGSAERWHRPDREVAVRQSVLDGAPVVQTSLRIPGGDARVHTYAVVALGAEWVVLDVVNAGRAPVAVAVVTRRVGAPDAAGSAWEHDGAVLRRSGSVVTVASRVPDTRCHGPGLEELATALTAGPAPDPDHASAPVPAPVPVAAAVTAQVFAVAHGTGVRVLVALGPPAGPGAMPDPYGVPAPEAVIRGWRRQLDAVCRFRFADDDTDVDVLRRRCRLLLCRDATGPADLSALAAFGHAEEAAQRLDRALSALRRPVEVGEAQGLLVAASDVVAWTPDAGRRRELAWLLADPVLQLAGWARPPRRDRSAAAAADRRVVDWATARILARTGEHDEPMPDDATVAAVAGQRAATAASDGDGAALLAVRSVLVADDVPGRVDLLPGWSAAWAGRPLEVHDLPTAAGPLSFAVRWHGARPALLWQIEGFGSGAPFALGVGSLDPGFATASVRGEALLAEPPAAPAASPAPSV